MLAAAKAGTFKTLYVFCLSRLARESIITMPMLKELVLVHCVRVISVTEGFDTNQPGWVVSATFLSLFHEIYIKDLAANVHRGQVGTVLARFSVGDYRYGYTSVPSPGGETIGRGRNAKPRMVYRIDESQADWVRRIFVWFVLERQSLSWIIQELNRLQAPRDRRARSPKWNRAAVKGILRSPKYIGLWPWGLSTNVRIPGEGNIVQEERPAEESDKWLREFPELRLVDDATYEIAQRLLNENEDECDQCRKDDGGLNGSLPGKFGQHILAGLVQCSQCGSKLCVGGSNGKYLLCPDARDGICGCRTQLPRDLAQKLVLDEVGNRIVGNPKLTDAVHQILCCTWEEMNASRPDDAKELKAQIDKHHVKIDRLLDECEESERPDPSIKHRLVERRRELADLEKRLGQLGSQTIEMVTRPTLDETKELLSKLGDVLRSPTPAANEAMRNILSGPIIVDEIPVAGKKRRFWRGTFTLRADLLAATISRSITAGACYHEPTPEPITLDFRSVTKTAEQGVRAWELYLDKVLNIKIAKELGVSKARISVILKAAAAERGVPYVDGRARRSTLEQKTIDSSEHDQLLADAKRLYDEDLPMQEIGVILGVCRDTVTHLIQEWHTANGLPMEDGRARRARINKRTASIQVGMD